MKLIFLIFFLVVVSGDVLPQGVTRFGENTSSSTYFVNKNGRIRNGAELNINGQILTVTDIDGNVYHTVKIGSQIWMSENLKTTRYNDGTTIAFPGTDKTAWQNNTTGAYAWYSNNEVLYKNIYGALYNWYSLDATSNGNKNVCPTGWHVPTDAEWNSLNSFLGGESVAGGKIKEAGITHWYSPNVDATNSSGFTALPGGFLWFDGTYYDMPYIAVFWTSTSFNSGNAWRLWPHSSTATIYHDSSPKNNGFSVRCLKD